MALTHLVALALAFQLVAAAPVAPFTSFDAGGDWTGKTIRIRPASADGPQVEGAVGVVDGDTLKLNCDAGCSDLIDIYAPVNFNNIAAAGVAGVIRVSDHDEEPMTCKGGLFQNTQFTASVSASTNVSLGCIVTDTLILTQSGEVSAISTWWTLTAGKVLVTNTGEGASTHLLGDFVDVQIVASGEKATVTVRDSGTIITGSSVGGRIYYNADSTGGSCDVKLPGPLGSACLPLPSLEVQSIRALSFSSWSNINAQSSQG